MSAAADETVRRALPRPERWRLGAPSAWRASHHDGPVTLARVRAALAGHRTGSLDAELPAVAELPGVTAAPDSFRSAVLAAIFEERGEARLVLERRSDALARHGGQVALPGGRLEPGERAVDAAIREAHEEVGIDPAHIEVLGRLTPLRTYNGASVIEPFVGALPSRPVLTPEPAEVAYCFDVSLRELLADGTFREELWGREGDAPDPPFVEIVVFETSTDTIWGATARILAELCAIVAGTPAP